MVSILAQFGICIDEEYQFRLWGKERMPISLTLEEHINNLYPFGKIYTTQNNINLSKEYKNTIKIIGETIKKFISNKENKTISLITLSKMIYIKNQNLSINQIQELTSNTQSEIESCIKLIRHIENKI